MRTQCWFERPSLSHGHAYRPEVGKSDQVRGVVPSPTLSYVQYTQDSTGVLHEAGSLAIVWR